MRFADLCVVSIYISPNCAMNYFLNALDELRSFCVTCDCPYLIICGDLNSRSRLWGYSRTNVRGRILEGWLTERDLRISNVGNTPTCVRPQESSIVDLTIISASLIGRVSDWHVVQGFESFSDHRYIFFRMSWGLDAMRQLPGHMGHPRWSFKEFNKPLFTSLIELKLKYMDQDQSIEEQAVWMARTTQEACDVAAKRVRSRPRATAVYWWNEEVAFARRICIGAFRKWKRAKRIIGNSPSGNRSQMENRRIEYRLSRRLLRLEIKRAKTGAWRSLLESIDEDPWGLPYKLVLNKLRYSAPGLTETLSARKLDLVIDTLFPAGPAYDPIKCWGNARVPSSKCQVSVEEVSAVLRANRKSGNPAPGPDGIPIGIWKCASPLVLAKLAELFTACFKSGVFPKKWKIARLVLILKGGQTGNSNEDIPKARPICLLDEIGKIQYLRG